MLRAVAPPITPGDLREACTIGLAVPIAGEMPLPTLHRLREVSRVLIADAQGFVRAWDQAGKVVHSPPTPELLATLEQLDYLKIGRDEAFVLDASRLRRSCTVLLTDGARRCTVLSATLEQRVAAFPAHEIDPTGAGDCFLAGFAVGLLRGWPAARAARLGNWCGARAVEVAGIPAVEHLPTFS